MELNKSYLKSKTLWVNLIAFVALLAQGFLGFVISPEIQMGLLMVVNVILRVVTKEPIVWK